MPVTNIKSKWSSGELIFYQSTAANSKGIQFGQSGDDFPVKFYSSDHDAAGTVSGSQTGVIKVKVNGTDLYIPCYAAIN